MDPRCTCHTTPPHATLSTPYFRATQHRGGSLVLEPNQLQCFDLRGAPPAGVGAAPGGGLRDARRAKTESNCNVGFARRTRKSARAAMARALLVGGETPRGAGRLVHVGDQRDDGHPVRNPLAPAVGIEADDDRDV